MILYHIQDYFVLDFVHGVVFRKEHFRMLDVFVLV